MAQQSERLAAVLEPVVRELGLELYDVELGGSARSRTLRVLVDRDGGVDLDAISSATEALAPVLDRDAEVAKVLPGAYLLEVSSPGVERPLRTPAHFRRALGSVVSLKSRDAQGAVTRRRAVLTAADDDGVEIEIDGARERVAYDDIVASHTVFEWGPAPKPGKSTKTGKPKPSTSTKPTVPARG
jgi:ribosome maturation factor RimP